MKFLAALTLLVPLVACVQGAELSLLFRMIGGESSVRYNHHGQGGHPVPETDRPQLTISYSLNGNNQTLVLRHGVNGYLSGVGATIMKAYPDENLVDPPNSNPGGRAPEKEGYIKAKQDVTRRGLIQFDLESLPAGASIQSASLRLRTTAIEGYGSGTTGDLWVYHLPNRFSLNEVTWKSRLNGSPWITAGGNLTEQVFVFPMRNNSNIVGTKPGTHTMDLTEVVKTVFQNDPTRIESGRIVPFLQGTYSAYPNPFKTSVRIQGLDLINSTDIRILDVQGRVIETLSPKSHSATASILWSPGKLPAGTYFLKTRSKTNQSFTKKLILKR